VSASHHLPLAASLRWRGFQLAGAVLQRSGPSGRLLAPLAGRLAWMLAPTQRQAVSTNLRILLPEAPPGRVRQAAIGAFRSVVRYYVELARVPVSDLRAIHAAMTVEGYEIVETARAAGHGVIVAGIHLGPTELLLQAFAVRGVSYTAMIERLQPPQLNALFLQWREAHGQRYVYADVAGARALLKALRAGGIVALLIDRDVTGTGVAVPFAGGSVRAPTGVIDLARASGAPIIPAIAQWTRRGTRAIFLPPITIERTLRAPEAQRAALAALLRRYLPYLRAHPEQWLVLEPWFVTPAAAVDGAYTEAERPSAAGREGQG